MSLLNFSLKSPHFVERLWDVLCCISIVGIYPRFIEPSLIFPSKYTIPLADLPQGLDGLRIVHISDLHCSSYTTKHFLDRIRDHIERLSPHLIVFTGDLLTYAELDSDKEGILLDFLQSLHAPMGCFAVLGNHDYAQYVSYAEDGTVHIIQDHIPTIIAGFYRLFGKESNKTNPKLVEPLEMNAKLLELYKKTNIRLLHNETVQIGSQNNRLNLTGLGDIMAKQCDPFQAFTKCDTRLATVVLSHNPDSFPHIKNYPGDLFLFGHTHGGQVNLPYIWKKITPLENTKYKSGLFHENGRFLFINRGLGATLPFRLFAPPEIALLTLVQSGVKRVPVWQKNFLFEKKPKPALSTSISNEI